jgi:hypothetical protein
MKLITIFQDLNDMKQSTHQNKIIYSLNIADLQTVAENFLDRKLSSDEIKRVIEKLPNYIDWYDAIENTLRAVINK